MSAVRFTTLDVRKTEEDQRSWILQSQRELSRKVTR